MKVYYPTPDPVRNLKDKDTQSHTPSDQETKINNGGSGKNSCFNENSPKHVPVAKKQKPEAVMKKRLVKANQKVHRDKKIDYTDNRECQSDAISVR